jgi:hypothetical protein
LSARLVGQVGNLRRVVNPPSRSLQHAPKSAGYQPARRMPSCPTSSEIPSDLSRKSETRLDRARMGSPMSLSSRGALLCAHHLRVFGQPSPSSRSWNAFVSSRASLRLNALFALYSDAKAFQSSTNLFIFATNCCSRYRAYLRSAISFSTRAVSCSSPRSNSSCCSNSKFCPDGPDLGS